MAPHRTHDSATARSRLERDTICATAQIAESVARVTAALLDGDRDLAEVATARSSVIEFDCEAMEDAAVAGAMTDGDPNVLIAAGRIAAELTAAAALARGIAGAVPRVPSRSLPPRVRGLLSRVGDETRHLMMTATQAWSSPVDASDVLFASEPRTAVVDDLHHRLLAELFAGVVPLTTSVELTLVGRRYERLAAHAVALADHVQAISRNDR